MIVLIDLQSRCSFISPGGPASCRGRPGELAEFNPTQAVVVLRRKTASHTAAAAPPPPPACFCCCYVTYLGLKTVTGLFLAWPLYLVTILLAAILEFGQFKGISHFRSWQTLAVRCSWHPFSMAAASSPFIHFAGCYFRLGFGVFLGWGRRRGQSPFEKQIISYFHYSCL